MLKKSRNQLLKIKKNPFIQKSLITLILRVFGAITLFGFTLFLTKAYSPKIVGQYDFVRSFLLVLGSVCLLGCDQSILYFRGRIKGLHGLSEIKNIYKKMVGIVFSMSIILFLIIFSFDKQFVSSFFSDSGVHLMLLKSSGVLFFYALTTLNIEVFRALDHFYVAEVFRNTIKYVPVILGAIVLNYYFNENYLVDVFLIGFIFLAILTTILIFYYFSKISISNETVLFSYKEIAVKSYPIAISGMAIFLLMSFDILFLKKYKDDETVAFYALAVKLMTILSMIIVTVNITVSTKIAEYFSTNNKLELIKTLKNSSRLIFSMTLPIAIFLCVFSETILGFFGNDYVAAREALVVLMVGQGICSVFGSAPVYLNMTGRQHTFQVILLLAVCINFALNRVLIPDYGMTGAAVAFVASSFFWNLLSAIVIYQKDKMKVFLN